MKNKNYRDELEALLIKNFIPAGYEITKNIKLDSVPENSKYEALVFTLNEHSIIYRKGKVTPDRPGAFLSTWQRPSSLISNNNNKPIPLSAKELDYLFVQVEDHSNDDDASNRNRSNNELISTHKNGLFIFPIALLIKKGIISSEKSKGKTGFRVFPPWSKDRGIVGRKVFSESGKKTQSWQLPYFLDIDENGLIDSSELHRILNNK